MKEEEAKDQDTAAGHLGAYGGLGYAGLGGLGYTGGVPFFLKDARAAAQQQHPPALPYRDADGRIGRGCATGRDAGD